MPVQSEKDWVHVRIRKTLADQLRVIAKRDHRYGIQVEANLAVETYIKKSVGLVVYAVFQNGHCIYVGATSNLSGRARDHWKKFGRGCRIEILDASNSFQQIKQTEWEYIRKFKALGQADFNTADYATFNPGFERVLLKNSEIKKFQNDLSSTVAPKRLRKLRGQNQE